MVQSLEGLGAVRQLRNSGLLQTRGVYVPPPLGYLAASMARRRSHDVDGTLQAEVMRIVWELGGGTVDDVRARQPTDRRPAYNTVQTVMNRLHDRGLLERERRGKAFFYSARYGESELLARSIGERLAEVSSGVRTEALLTLVDELGAQELDELARYANRVRRARKSP
jgi:predicted transcriptional regulator